MMIEIFIGIIAGVIAGCISGLIPGAHPNLFASIFLSYFYGLDPFVFSVFLLSSGITNSFISFIPSIYLGAPESESVLSVLPGHKMLLQGNGHRAIRLTVYGGLIGALIGICILPVLSFLLKWYENIKYLIPFGLIMVSVYMILTERKKLVALLVFLFSGLMGLYLLKFEMLFPVFTGFFGLPLLFLSWKLGSRIPERINFEEREERGIITGSVIGAIAGIMAGILPGIGSAQSSAIVQEIFKKKGDKIFLISLGSLTTVDIIFSVLAIYLIGNPRSGIAVAIMEKLGFFDFNILLFFILVSLTVIMISSYLTLKLSRIIYFKISQINYKMLSLRIFLILWILVFVISGIGGALSCLAAFFLGLFTNISKVKRTNLMGFLIVPTILFYLGF